MRVYSSTGCSQCKRRKKKCDEGHPICQACDRLGFRCDYSRNISTSTQVVNLHRHGIQSPLSPLVLTQMLPIARWRNSEEALIVSRIHPSMMRFFTAASNKGACDVGELWQMMFQVDLVRNALVACFSTILPQANGVGFIDRKAYGRAINLLQAEISVPHLYTTNKLHVQIAIVFLGLMESAGAEFSPSHFSHWKMLAMLIGATRVVRPCDLGFIPRPVFVLVLEALLFHLGTHSCFAADMSVVWGLWEHSRVLQKLFILNPPGLDHIGNSPLLFGQYEPYEMAVKVTFMFRLLGPGNVETHILDKVRFKALCEEEALHAKFLQMDLSEVSSRQLMRHAFLDTYIMFFQAIQICLVALQQPSRRRHDMLTKHVANTLGLYLSLEYQPVNNALLAWPIQILACSLREQYDQDSLWRKFDATKHFWDPGHLKRVESLRENLKELNHIHTNAEGSGTTELDNAWPLPIGLSLLHRAEGILS